MDAVEKAKSGHPGTPMSLAPAAFVIFDKFLKHNPKNPRWPNRDRFVLSAGHASMLLYSSLFVNGYDISIEDIKKFRTLHSRCPGHPEFGNYRGSRDHYRTAWTRVVKFGGDGCGRQVAFRAFQSPRP